MVERRGVCAWVLACMGAGAYLGVGEVDAAVGAGAGVRVGVGVGVGVGSRRGC
jgi:hypothetical protein